MQGFCFSITLHVRKQQMVRVGLFVLLRLTTNPQKHTEKSDVILQEMGAHEVKISRILGISKIDTPTKHDCWY